MRPCLLIVLTRTDWLGTARAPRMLARAGFDVALLTPPGSLAEQSDYVARIAHVSPKASPMAWIASLVQAIDDCRPRLIVPGDEMALRLLFRLVLEPPPALPAARRGELAALIVRSLGDPAHYAASIDKTLLPRTAAALGVRMPPGAVVDSVDAAVEVARALGGPRIVQKRRMGFGGGGVAIADTLGDVAAAAQRLLQRPEEVDLGEYARAQVLVQAYIDGPHHSQAVVALEGRVLAGFAWERYVATQPRQGQTSVLRFVESPETAVFAARIARGLGRTGFYNVQFLLDAKTGAAHLLEINRRIVTHTHLGERVGCDLGAALFAALDGRTAAPPVPRVEPDQCLAVFPREWLRDPESPYLARYPADVPWDEPRLFAAMTALWRE
jgi:glutathione synthase/RimK-type ligase-like ATP-grasp enzyme